MARGSDAFKTTSRDRISHLEDEIGALWAVVRELRAELGHKVEEDEVSGCVVCLWGRWVSSEEGRKSFVCAIPGRNRTCWSGLQNS